MENYDLINVKINKVYEAVEHVGFDVALNWKEELSYPYYEGFNNSDISIRKGSLFSFLGMLINHYYRSSLAFGPEKNEDKTNGEKKIHDITVFIRNFLENYNHLKSDFPITVFFVIKFLYLLDKELPFEERFEGLLYPDSFVNIREYFFETVDLEKYKYYSAVKEELGFPKKYF
ncbi:hypothetical protein [Lysinibacillus sp. 3P01SB]|uniref:hypothetical protein n=1 Tax=Lysinibacillus sp. 3P01SB TaxID=3132284 RepID=UPI0039A55D48